MTPNLRMEQRSLAVVRAVAADAGYQVVRPEPDIDSVDGVLMASFGRRPRIEFQAKATARDITSGDLLRFPLPVKNYDELRLASWTPRILIVALMPDEAEPWLSQTDDQLCLRSGVYWVSLTDMPEESNSASVTVHIPLANIFDREHLEAMMSRAEAGSQL